MPDKARSRSLIFPSIKARVEKLARTSRKAASSAPSGFVTDTSCNRMRGRQPSSTITTISPNLTRAAGKSCASRASIRVSIHWGTTMGLRIRYSAVPATAATQITMNNNDHLVACHRRLVFFAGVLAVSSDMIVRFQGSGALSSAKLFYYATLT